MITADQAGAGFPVRWTTHPDLEAEARRRAVIPKVYFMGNKDTGTDTSKLNR